MESIFLYNAGNDEYIEVQLSKDDIVRVANDAVFANNEIIEQRSPSDRTIASTSSAVNEGIENDEIENEETVCTRWSPAAILLLLQTYKKYETNLQSGKKSTKKVWEEIASSMQKEAPTVSYTGLQCSAKLRNLKKRYKLVKDHNSKSGNDRQDWEFYKTMDELFGKKAWCAPVAIASSTGLATVNEEEIKSKVSTSKSKRSVAALLEDRNRQKEEHQAKRMKRHEERMEMDKKLLDLLTKIVDKM